MPMSEMAAVYTGGVVLRPRLEHRFPPFRSRTRWEPPTDLEREALGRNHPNVLIQGTPADIEQTLTLLQSSWYRARHAFPDIPLLEPDDRFTLFVREVGKLPPPALRLLAGLIDGAAGRVQIVSTSSSPLYEQVARGEFPSDLYYRLNVMTFHRTRSSPR
jgi:hypothetical protein